MTLERPAYGTGNKKQTKSAFGGRPMDLPAFDTPISVKENFYRMARHENPLWVPLGSGETMELHMAHIYTKGPEGHQLGPILGDPRDRYTYFDAFGNSWTYDKNAGGACMTIGTRICDDILKWEEQIPWPDLHEYNLDERAAEFMKNEYDPDRVLILDIYHGPFQALADVMGGFSEALEAMFVEPEATRAFFDRFTDWMIWLMDRLSGLYPVDLFCVHDDWGTEKDAFFSPDMMRELLFEPTRKMIDHAHGLGKLYTFHCCGKVDKFLDAFVELGADFMQLQRRVNDLPEYKKNYGDKLGFYAGLEDFNMGKKYSEEELRQVIRDNIELFAPTGGYLPSLMARDPETLWTMASELYCYSREFYEK